jgi:uncharacterized membrane-anchored protein
MKIRNVLLLAAVGLALVALPSRAEKKELGVLHGPTTAKLGKVAQVEVPTGYIFLDGDATRAMMKRWGEPVSGSEVGMLSPTNGDWSVFFDFSDSGYIKDDDKDKLDADKLLAAIKEGNEEGNKERRRAGNPPLNILGWEKPPHYDETTHNLEWAIRCESEGRPILNYNTRLLGRKGYMSVVLVVEPDALTKTLPEFKDLLANHKFSSGESYAEYKPGDKVAKYGLAALVLGGAGVGAAKLGLFAWLAVLLKKAWKLVVVAAVAVASLFKKFFGRFFGGNKAPDEL